MAVILLRARSCHQWQKVTFHRFSANFVACWADDQQRGRPGLRRRRTLRARRAARGLGHRPLRRGAAGAGLRGLRAGRRSGDAPRAASACSCQHDLSRAAEADLVARPGVADAAVPRPEPSSRRCARAHARGARVLSLCTGAFVLGAGGPARRPRPAPPTGGTPTELAARFPRGARACPRCSTSTTTGCSPAPAPPAGHRRLPAPVARGVRRRRRQRRRPADGGAAAARGRPGAVHPLARCPDCDAETLGPLLLWITEHLARAAHASRRLARPASMSPRTFARRFRAETGTTPHAWLTSQRVLRAEELLETTDRSVDWIADEVGFGTAAMLRHHFTRARSVSPQQYRRTFSSRRRLAGLTRDPEQAGQRRAGAPCRWRCAAGRRARRTPSAAWAVRAARRARAAQLVRRSTSPTTAAQTRWPQRSSGTPNTATSLDARVLARGRVSTSAG